MIWDLRHPEDAIFVPVSLIGFSKKVLPVFEWSVRTLDPDLLEALGGLPRGRRSVPPDLAARFCPELIIRYGVALLNKKLDAVPHCATATESIGRGKPRIYPASWGCPPPPKLPRR